MVWLRILGPYWCMYFALFGDDGVTAPKDVGAVLM